MTLDPIGEFINGHRQVALSLPMKINVGVASTLIAFARMTSCNTLCWVSGERIDCMNLLGSSPI